MEFGAELDRLEGADVEPSDAGHVLVMGVEVLWQMEVKDFKMIVYNSTPHPVSIPLKAKPMRYKGSWFEYPETSYQISTLASRSSKVATSWSLIKKTFSRREVEPIPNIWFLRAKPHRKSFLKESLWKNIHIQVEDLKCQIASSYHLALSTDFYQPSS